MCCSQDEHPTYSPIIVYNFAICQIFLWCARFIKEHLDLHLNAHRLWRHILQERARSKQQVSKINICWDVILRNVLCVPKPQQTLHHCPLREHSSPPYFFILSAVIRSWTGDLSGHSSFICPPAVSPRLHPSCLNHRAGHDRDRNKPPEEWANRDV